MPLTDLTLDELQAYRSGVQMPGDFDDFWGQTLDEARSAATPVTRTEVTHRLTAFAIEDLTFSGFNGDPIKAWVISPAAAQGPLPTVVEYLGYGGGRGLPGALTRWAGAGYTHVIMDTRGQGSANGTGGHTPDPQGSGPAAPGSMTQGITSRETYYYRRVFTDAVRLLDDVVTLPQVDSERVLVTGTSQGGGICLAAAALSEVPQAVLPDVPFLCDFPRSVQRTPRPPFSEIVGYLAIHRGAEEEVMRTLAYFDGVNFARKITIPTLVSVALMDDTVLPSSVYGAYHALAAQDRELSVYPYNGHEGGGAAHWLQQLDWAAARLS